MRSERAREGSGKAFLRFGLSGMVFTIIGPSLYWLAYPLGPFVAVAAAELLVHIIRFATFRTLVFPASKGYQVSLQRYVISALPASLTGVLTVALFQNRFDRTTLTFILALVAMIIGFVWSRYVYYYKPAIKR